MRAEPPDRTKLMATMQRFGLVPAAPRGRRSTENRRSKHPDQFRAPSRSGDGASPVEANASSRRPALGYELTDRHPDR